MRISGTTKDYPFPLQFKRSARAKRLRLTVRVGGVECVMPMACAEAQALAFIDQHREWLLAKYREAVARVPASNFWDEIAAGGEVMLPFRGCETPLRISGTSGTRVGLHLTDEVFDLHLPDRQRERWHRLGEHSLFTWARSWLREQAFHCIQQHWSTALLQPRHIRIKRMRTRWGSCGAHNDINLNWLLMFAPPSVLEYVVVHELCHIRHRDHSARFWALVANHLPNYRADRRWLKAYGSRLMLRFGEIRA